MRSVPSQLLQKLRSCDCKKTSWPGGTNLLGVTGFLCPTSGKWETAQGTTNYTPVREKRRHKYKMAQDKMVLYPILEAIIALYHILEAKRALCPMVRSYQSSHQPALASAGLGTHLFTPYSPRETQLEKSSSSSCFWIISTKMSGYRRELPPIFFFYHQQICWFCCFVVRWLPVFVCGNLCSRTVLFLWNAVSSCFCLLIVGWS